MTGCLHSRDTPKDEALLVTGSNVQEPGTLYGTTVTVAVCIFCSIASLMLLFFLKYKIQTFQVFQEAVFKQINLQTTLLDASLAGASGMTTWRCLTGGDAASNRRSE